MRATIDIAIKLRRREGSANPNIMWKVGIPRFLHEDDGLAFWFVDQVVLSLQPVIVLMTYNAYD